VTLFIASLNAPSAGAKRQRDNRDQVSVPHQHVDGLEVHADLDLRVGQRGTVPVLDGVEVVDGLFQRISPVRGLKASTRTPPSDVGCRPAAT